MLPCRSFPPWESLPSEHSMPGRLQEGQLLHSDDEPSDETDSNGTAQRRLQRAQEETGGRRQGLQGGDESGTDTDEDGQLIKAKARAQLDKQKPSAKRRTLGKSRAGAGITLGLLIKEGILWPGEDVLTVEYKSVMTHATLTPDGQITCKINGSDTTFESPSAFSIFLKRMVNPNRKADDGWKTVKYNGKFLETYKMELAKRRLKVTEAGTPPDGLPLAKKAKAEMAMALSGMPQSVPRVAGAANGDTEDGNLLANASVQEGRNLEDINQMIPCERYRVALLMDFHAQLSSNEIIGLLGGTWQPLERILRVERAFPVEECKSEVDTLTVEMEKHDEERIKGKMAHQFGLRCVGWYHSHPHAAPHPSTSDIIYQIAQQKQHRIEQSSDEPFIGAIVATNALTKPSESPIAYFCTEYPEDREILPHADPIGAGCLPMEIEVEEEASPATDSCVASMAHSEIRLVAQQCATSMHRADIHTSWNGELTLLGRLKQTVAARLPGHWPTKRVDEYLQKVEAVVTAAWSFFHKKEATKQRVDEDDLEISDVSQSEAHEAQDAGLADDATKGHLTVSGPPTNGHGCLHSSVEEASNRVPYSHSASAAREEISEPAASSYFNDGAAFESGPIEDSYVDGLLGSHMSYRGTASPDSNNDDDTPS